MANFMTVVILLLLISPSYAASEATIPYIEIKNPTDGETVDPATNLVVVAEGYELRNPFVSITGEYVGTVFPLKECIYEATPEPGMPIKMYCNAEIDLSGFENQKIRLGVSVIEGEGTLTDSVGLFVSGQCA